ncbi:MAG: hypothetical protein RRA35_07765, partial [Desulfomonilia bacterium]|nr:hypothetical protein [Desulfomonilia bacterium]
TAPLNATVAAVTAARKANEPGTANPKMSEGKILAIMTFFEEIEGIPDTGKTKRPRILIKIT